MSNRKSPIKQQRVKNSNFLPVSNSNRMRPNSSTGGSHLKNSNSQYRHNSNTNSPTAMSASLLPAVPLFYSNTYADPPDCSCLPKPPESWYITANNNENIPVQTEEKKVNPKQKNPRNLNHKIHNNNNNKGLYKSCYQTKTYDKFPTTYIAVKG